MSTQRSTDHTALVFSTDLVTDEFGWSNPRSVVADGITFTFDGAAYTNPEQGEWLYLEGTDDGSEFWYAEISPIS